MYFLKNCFISYVLLKFNKYFLYIGDSERFSRRGNDKGHRRRLKGGERIFKSYQATPSNILQVVDEANLLFSVHSETIEGTWYNVSLNTYFCNCPDRNATCKHILGVQRIVKEHFQTPRENEMAEDIMVMEDNISNIASISPIITDVGVEESSASQEADAKLLTAITEVEALLQNTKASIGDYTDDEKEHKVQVLQSFLTSFSEPFTFQRPATIDLPRQGSISIIQENIKRTRMGHGKRRMTSESVEEGASQPPSKRPSHMLISHSKQKRAIFRKLPKVTCDICATKTLVEGGATSISCKNCDHEIFVQ